MAERKVLIIDDDDALLPMLKTAFKRYQFDVHVTSDGAEGLEKARKEVPDLVLLSVELPVGNGFLVCKEFKQDPKLKDIPVIITSRKATDADFEKHRKLKVRADDYLHKPFTDEELFAKVGNVVGFALSPDEFSELEAKVHDFLEERTKLEAEISEKADRIAELEAALDEAQATGGKKLQAELASRGQRISALESENTALEGRVAALQDELETTKKNSKDAGKIEKRLADAEVRIAELNQDLATHQAKAEEAEATLLERDARIAELENESGERAARIQALEDEASTQEARVAGLVAQGEAHVETIARLEEERDGLAAKVQSLEAESSAQAADAAAKNAELQAQLAAIGDERDVAVESLASAEKKLEQLEKIFGTSRDGLLETAETVKAETGKLQADLDASREKLEGVEAELAEARKTIDKEAKKRTKLREVLEKAVATLE